MSFMLHQNSCIFYPRSSTSYVSPCWSMNPAFSIQLKHGKDLLLDVYWQFAHAGDMETPLGGSWSALPQELEELILDHLSLVELTRASATCRTFHAAFGRQLAHTQKARCDVAVDCIGRLRLVRITSVINSFLKGQALGLDMGTSSIPGHDPIVYGCIWKDGVFQPAQAPLRGWVMDDAGRGAWFVRVRLDVTADGKPFPGASLHISVRARQVTRIDLSIVRRHGHEQSSISMNLDGTAGFEELGLLQALFSGEFAPNWQDAGPLMIHVWGSFQDGKVSQAGIEAQIAPLVPLLSQYTMKAPGMLKKYVARKRPGARGVGSAANQRLCLHYDARH
jgi:hypothetical protein